MPRIVVAGAGLMGSEIIRLLQSSTQADLLQYELVVIDSKEYFENPTGSVRAIVDPAFHTQTSKLHQHWLTRASLMVGQVEEVINDHQVNVKLLPSNEIKTVDFDYFVLATGTQYHHFKAEQVTYNDRVAFLQNFAQQIEQAKHIVIVGGGSTGIEVVGEILHYHPSKQVTLVHSHERLLETAPPRASQKATSYLMERNCKVVLNDRVVLSPEDLKDEVRVYNREIKTVQGKSFEADLLLRCFNGTPNTSALRANYAQCLDERGLVKTKPTLQLEGHPNILIAGDILAMPNAGAAANLQNVPGVIVSNITSLIQKRDPTATFNTNNAFAWAPMTTIGPSFAIAAFNSFCVCGFGCWASLKKMLQTKTPPSNGKQ